LQGNLLQNEGVILLMKALKLNNTLKELVIADNKFSEDKNVISEIESTLRLNQTLFKLDMKYNEIYEPGKIQMGIFDALRCNQNHGSHPRNQRNKGRVD
jgi:hypothetical protein